MKHLILGISLALALPSVAFAQQDDLARENATYSRASQIGHVLKGTMETEDVFAPSFLQAVPADQLATLAAQLVEANGPIETVDDVAYRGNGAASFDIVFERARGAASLQLAADEPYLVTGFRITDIKPVGDTPQKILADLGALSGTATLGVYRLGGDGPQSVLTQGATEQMAIGSTFKLWVLSALAHKVAAGELHWDDVVQLGARSIPSGQMQDWPTGAHVTLQTLATMMISISDNTATDTLIELLGRDAIAAEVVASGHSDPSRTLPFLKTVEMFALKTGDPARLAEYAAADDAAQAALLEQWALTSEEIDVPALIGSPPKAIDTIEWFASNEDIARIFKRLLDLGDQTALEILAVNPQVEGEEAAHWNYAGYKGGSEAGVLNLSWLLEDQEGRWFVASLSWNDPDRAVETETFLLLSRRLIASLHP